MSSYCLTFKYERSHVLLCLICYHNMPNLNNLGIVTMIQISPSKRSFRLLCQKFSLFFSYLQLLKNNWGFFIDIQ